jgi:hypothetical protein
MTRGCLMLLAATAAATTACGGVVPMTHGDGAGDQAPSFALRSDDAASLTHSHIARTREAWETSREIDRVLRWSNGDWTADGVTTFVHDAHVAAVVSQHPNQPGPVHLVQRRQTDAAMRDVQQALASADMALAGQHDARENSGNIIAFWDQRATLFALDHALAAGMRHGISGVLTSQPLAIDLSDTAPQRDIFSTGVASSDGWVEIVQIPTPGPLALVGLASLAGTPRLRRLLAASW